MKTLANLFLNEIWKLCRCPNFTPDDRTSAIKVFEHLRSNDTDAADTAAKVSKTTSEALRISKELFCGNK